MHTFTINRLTAINRNKKHLKKGLQVIFDQTLFWYANKTQVFEASKHYRKPALKTLNKTQPALYIRTGMFKKKKNSSLFVN